MFTLGLAPLPDLYAIRLMIQNASIVNSDCQVRLRVLLTESWSSG